LQSSVEFDEEIVSNIDLMHGSQEKLWLLYSFLGPNLQIDTVASRQNLRRIDRRRRRHEIYRR